MCQLLVKLCIHLELVYTLVDEGGGSVVKYLTRDRGAVALSLTGGTAF